MKIRSSDRGSITMEASIMVPVFIILMLFVNGFFFLFMGQQIMTNALIQSTKSLSFDPYSIDRTDGAAESELMNMVTDISSFAGGNYTSTDKWYEEDNVGAVAKERFVAYLKAEEKDADKLLEVMGIENGVDGLDFSGSTVEDGVLTINLKYNQEFIFNTFGMAVMSKDMSVKVKLLTYNTIS